MIRRSWIGMVAAALLGMSPSAWSQQVLGPPQATPISNVVIQDIKAAKPAAPAAAAPVVNEAPAGVCCKERCDGWGPTMPENVGLFGPFLKRCDGTGGINVYGWLNGGYTYSSTGSGALAVQPRMNRFGNEFLANQLAIVFEKPLKSGEFNMGFNATFYAGADPATIAPLGGFTTTNPRFGADFRQLYVSAHLPILTEGGMDVKAGRMGSVIGWESALAPYRPFYSNDYQWFYAQDGAFTGVLTNLHVNNQLDFINGVTFGANTFFAQRGTGVCYLGQVNYWTSPEKRTMLSASTYIGNQALFAAGPGFIGDSDYMVEMRVQHSWNKCLTQIIQSDLLWASGVPGIGTTEYYTLYSIWTYHATKRTDVNLRAELARDVQGSRTGVRTTYGEVTIGLDYHPTKSLRIRPEVRGDFSERPAFGPLGDRQRQLTIAVDAIWSF